jgi:tetratricopeptide (TPR) repeat protein
MPEKKVMDEKKCKTFCLVDPNLKDFLGHDFEYDHSLLVPAEKEGYKVVVLGHRQVQSAVSTAMPIRSVFPLDIWGDYPRWARLSYIGQSLNHWLCNYTFYRALQRGLAGIPLTRDTLIFGHMITANQLLGWAWWLRKLKRPCAPQTVLLLRYQPAFYEDACAAKAFRILEELATQGIVRLGTDSDRLAQDYSYLTSLPIEVFSIPHTVHTVLSPQHACPNFSNRPLRLVSLGNARDEKGYLEILQAIHILHAYHGATGLEFVLQSNRATREVEDAIHSFQKYGLPNVRLLFAELKTQEYYQLLQSADVVLLPYWRNIYEARTSGILVEALAAGKPVIVTEDTWMSDQLKEYGSGLVCRDHSPQKLVQAILEIKTHYPAHWQRAQETRAAWQAKHNPQVLFQQLAIPPAPLLKSSKISRAALLYPWGNLRERKCGASLRGGLFLDFLKENFAQVRVLEIGDFPEERTNKFYHEFYTQKNPLIHKAETLFHVLLAILTNGRSKKQDFHLWQFYRFRLDRVFAQRVWNIVRWADVVFLEYTYFADAVSKACRSLGKKLIISDYDIVANQVTSCSWLRNLTRREEFRSLQMGDYAVCVSSADQKILSQHAIQAENIPHPVNIEEIRVSLPLHLIESVLQEFCQIAPPYRNLCLFVGSNFEANEIAVQYIRQIAQEMAALPNGEEVRFIIIGACAKPERSGNFIALGKVEEIVMRALYQVADIVLIPLPFGTGASLKTIEAMAYGKVVLGTKVGFRGLEVESDKHCVICDDLTQYPQLIAQLLMSREKRLSLAENAYQFAQQYDFRQVYRRYLELIGEPSQALPLAKFSAEKFLERLLFRAGQEALAKQHIKLAQQITEDLVARNPDSPQVHYLLSLCHYQQHKILGNSSLEKALRHCNLAVEKGFHEDFSFYCHRSKILEELGQREAAATDLRMATFVITTAKLREELWKLFFQGDYGKVQMLIEDKIAEAQHDSNLHYLLALSRHSLGMTDSSTLHHYDQALQCGFDKFWVYFHRARLWKNLDKIEAARCEVKKAIACRPNQQEALQLLQQIEDSHIWQIFFQKEYGKVAVIAKRRLRREPHHATLYYLLAHARHNLGYFGADVAYYYRQALAYGFDEFWAHFHLSRLLKEQGNITEARMHAEKAIAIKPNEPEACRWLQQLEESDLWALLAQGNYGKILDIVENRLKCQPQDGNLHYLKALSRHNLGKLDEPTLSHYDQALLCGFEEYWIYFHRARLWRDRGNSQAAMADMEKALTLQPSNREALQLCQQIVTAHAWQLFSQGDYEQLIGELKTKLAQTPQNGTFHYLCALSRHNLGKIDAETLAHYQQALEHGFDEFWARFHRAHLYQAQGNNQAALADIDKILVLKPESIEAHQLLREVIHSSGWQFFFKHAYGKVIALVEPRLAQEPADGIFHYLLALSLHQLGNIGDKVLAHYDHALQYGFDEFWVRFHRARLLKETGKIAEARRDVERAIALKPENTEIRQLLRQIDRMQSMTPPTRGEAWK